MPGSIWVSLSLAHLAAGRRAGSRGSYKRDDASISLFGVRVRPPWPRARTRRRVARALRALPVSLRVSWAWSSRGAVVRGERRLPGRPQAERAVLPGQRHARQDPSETWRDYGPTFRANATPVITPALLAALAQVEGREPRGPDVLAMAADVATLRALPAGLERRRHCTDHRRTFREAKR